MKVFINILTDITKYLRLDFVTSINRNSTLQPPYIHTDETNIQFTNFVTQLVLFHESIVTSYNRREGTLISLSIFRSLIGGRDLSCNFYAEHPEGVEVPEEPEHGCLDFQTKRSSGSGGSHFRPEIWVSTSGNWIAATWTRTAAGTAVWIRPGRLTCGPSGAGEGGRVGGRESASGWEISGWTGQVGLNQQMLIWLHHGDLAADWN
jgi:hypothetical protein